MENALKIFNTRSRRLCVIAAALLALALTGCRTISGDNIGGFPVIPVPAKDFTSLGLVFSVSVIEEKQGEIFTYQALLREAEKLGGDSIVNVSIDVKREGRKFLMFTWTRKETWYGSATAIKYVDGTLKNVSTTRTESAMTVTETVTESVIMASGGSGSGGFVDVTSSSISSERKWYKPSTWSRR